MARRNYKNGSEPFLPRHYGIRLFVLTRSSASPAEFLYAMTRPADQFSRDASYETPDALSSPPLQIDVVDLHEQHPPETQPLAGDETSSRAHEKIQVKPRTAPGKPTKPAKKEEPVLRYRKTPIVLLVFYLITLIVPFILTCILDKRPLTTSTYNDQRGRVDSYSYLSFWGLLAFIQALRSVSGILTIPITTTILGYAAVTFAQKRFDGQRLSISQLFALTDRGWADITILLCAGSNGMSSGLLRFGGLLIAIGIYGKPLFCHRRLC